MSLREYKAKRNFRLTPEPAGAVRSSSKSAPRASFVIHQHFASRLHYDLRLELDGVLKSWAVPKGPSLDPNRKVLAVQVEDHPLAYGRFEGEIPKGQYGAGKVNIWDRGTWTALNDPRSGLKTGKLQFQLAGQRLQGVWNLIRMKGAGKKNQDWLLIKQPDEFARPGTGHALLEEFPGGISEKPTRRNSPRHKKSVPTRRRRPAMLRPSPPHRNPPKQLHPRKQKTTRSPKSLSRQKREQLIARAKELPAAVARKQPRTLRPQLATLRTAIPPGENWLHEVKFDGYRVLAVIERGQIRLLTRQGHDWSHHLPELSRLLRNSGLQNAILDGEVVALDDHGVANFQKLQNSIRAGQSAALIYYLFDMVHFEGLDLTQTPLILRKTLLSEWITALNLGKQGILRYSDHYLGPGTPLWRQACQQHLEGVISKRTDATYQSTRTGSWIKTKCQQRQEFVVGGYTPPQGSRRGFGSLLLGYYDEARQLTYCGRVGTGFTAASLKELADRLAKLRRKTPAFAVWPLSLARIPVTWVQPRLVIEVEFAQWTQAGLLRAPSFKGLRQDKSPRQVHQELPRPQKRRQRGTRKVQVHRAALPAEQPEVAGIAISHPDRLVFPESGISKLDVARYYSRIGRRILPHLVNRPLMLRRCPEGRTHPCFFQKHAGESIPPSIRRVSIREKTGQGEYLVIDDLAGLIHLVQFGVIEFHVWPTLASRLDSADRLIFDLDPGPGVDWKTVIQAAEYVREALSSVGLQSFARVSGGKGLHVVAPLNPPSAWADFESAAATLAQSLAAEHPDLFVTTIRKSRRRGKIFLDYLRNRRGATTVASYSLRAKPDAPIAWPLDWKQLKSLSGPNGITLADVMANRRLPAASWSKFFRLRQSLPKRD